jgi:uncharacterized protein (TIGR02145 family)
MNGLLIRKYNDGSISKPISPHVLGGVTDIDGNRYRTIIIGTQEWTIDNLRTSRFTDGTLIPIVKDDFKWAGMKTPAYCFYNNSNDSNFIVRQGALYNGLCISGDKNLAPKGWRIPSRRDWDILWEYMVFHGYNWDGRCKGNKYAKAIADSIMWISSSECQLGNVGKEIGDNNSSGFSALPCGRRNDFTFDDFGKSAYFWSSTMEAIKIENIRDDVDCIMVTGSQGYSVRIVRDIDTLLCK